MRLFVAVEPPPQVLDDVAVAVETIRPAAPPLRWARREQWHVTLAFLGEVDDLVRGRVEERLGRAAARYGPLVLQLAGGGRFGDRTLWAGVDGDVDRLSALAASVAAAARRAGVDVEHRRYRPHLTLARAPREGAELRGLVEQLATWRSEPWEVTEVALVRSHLGARPTYETLGRHPLAAGDA